MANLTLEELIARIEAVESIAERAAPRAAANIERLLKDNCQNGVDPYGKKWAPRKKDGKRALENSAQAVTCGAVGNTIVMTTTGPTAVHDQGLNSGARPTATRSKKRRPITNADAIRKILPDEDLPKEFQDAIQDALEETLGEIL